MIKRRRNQCVAFLTAAISVFMTSCGSLPEQYPGIEESAVQVDLGDRFQVNFFYQNTENTYCIRPDGNAYKFFGVLSQTFSIMNYSDLSKTYIMDYDDEQQKYEIVEYDRNEFNNMQWEEAKNEYSYSGKNKDAKNSFYVLETNHDITMESRVEGGFLNLYMEEVRRQNIADEKKINELSEVEEVSSAVSSETEEDTAATEIAAESDVVTDRQESFFNPDAINVIFTDLSEKNITYLGEELRRYYIEDNRYSACVLAIKLELQKDQLIYYASKDNANSLTKDTSGDSRWFYLLMTGPTTDLATFVQNLTLRLNEANLKEGSASGGYEMSDINFTAQNFNISEDLTIETLDATNTELAELQEEYGNDALFERALVRLEPVSNEDSVFPVGIYRDEILEYRYVRSEDAFNLEGYEGASTDDFALNIYLDKEIERHDLVAESTKLSYVFGDPVIYYQNGDQWTEMDPDHQERFFHKISTKESDGKMLTLVGDYSDECGIHDIYVTVPILQRATVSNVVSSTVTSNTSWILNECTYDSSNVEEEMKRTYYFDKFYMNLFDLEMEKARDENGNLYETYQDVYSQIDELKILIEDIH